MTDIQTFDRVPTSLAATIITEPGVAPVACMIRDLSASGAKLEIDTELALPAEFAVAILETGQVLRAETRWRYGSKLGVRFVSPDEVAPDAPTREMLAAENVKLWAALETLAKRLTQLGELVVLPIELRSHSALVREAVAGRQATGLQHAAMPIAGA